MPRLATFCPFCENVQHAFRKGARSDVIRAGQIVFDFDSVAAIGMDEDVLPAYEENMHTDQQRDAFVLNDDDEEEEEEIKKQESSSKDRTPQLLHSSRFGKKQEPIHAQIDKSKSAKMAPDVALKGLPTMTSLRQSLTNSISSGGEPDERGNTSLSERKQMELQKATDSSDYDVGSPRKARNETSDLGLTRQYWLRPSDTLTSLCLRFRVNAATVCKLNDLPLSTATTTPHLIHTRQFLLIPESAVQFVLSSATGDAQDLQSALDGPAAQTRRQKVQRARREAQSRFRAIVAKNESITKGKGRADNGDITLCDDRAAKAYISLMEAELRCIDFGDGNQEGDQKKGDKDEDDILEELDAVAEAGRRERFNTVVKQAICRWEMDSDWERQQRAMGLTPIEGVAAPSLTNSAPSSNNSSWFKKWTSTPHHDHPTTTRVGWLEKVR